MHDEHDSHGEHDPQHARRWWILAVICLAQLMDVLDVTIVNIALPDARQSLGFSVGDRQWIVTAYSLAFGSLLLFSGRVSDLVGRRRMFLVGLVAFAAASALGGAAPNLGVLVTARAVQGAAGAMLAPAALSLLSTTFTEPKERAKAFAVFGGVSGSGAAIGMLLGGVLTEFLNWRFTLYVNVAIAVVAFIGAATLIQRRNETRSETGSARSSTSPADPGADCSACMASQVSAGDRAEYLGVPDLRRRPTRHLRLVAKTSRESLAATADRP